MIDLHYWPTPNGHKITMFLEEIGLPYIIVPVNIGAGRAVQAGLPQDRSEQPHARHRRPRPGGRRRADLGLRVGRHPASISPRRPDASCRRMRAAGTRCSNGCSGRWAASGRWPARTIISRPTRPRSCPMRSSATSRRPTGSMACSTAGLPIGAYLGGDYSIADMAAYPWVVPYERQGPEP